MNSLPVLSSLTELLNDTFTEEFKKLVQPASLVAAAIFLSLNLLLIAPVLTAEGMLPLLFAQRLPTIWQILIGTLVLLALGYLINSLGSSFVALLNGSAFRDSPVICSYLRERQARTYRKLQETAGASSTEPAQTKSAAAYRLATEYPHSEELLAPTRLGNVLLNPGDYSMEKYGAHLDTLWPIMGLMLQEKEDDKLYGQITDRQNRLTFLASVSVLVFFVGIELLIVNAIWTRSLWNFGFSVCFAALAYLVYLAAVKEALTWGRYMRVALDTRMDDLASKLQLREIPREDFAARRIRWFDVSKWLAYGGADIPGYRQPPAAVDWYVKPPASVFEVKAPATVSVTNLRGVRHGGLADGMAPTTRWFLGSSAEYVHVVSNPAGKQALVAQAVQLLVSDSALKTGQSVSGTLNGREIGPASWVEGASPTLAWAIGNVPAHGAVTLSYVARHKDDLEVEIRGGPSDVKITDLRDLTDVGIEQGYALTLSGGASDALVETTCTLHTGKRLDQRALWEQFPRQAWLTSVFNRPSRGMARWQVPVPANQSVLLRIYCE